MSRPANIAVIGAGVVGLSCSVQLQNAFHGAVVTNAAPGATVTIIADKFERETVSDGAAGSFRPTGDLVRGVPRETLRYACRLFSLLYSAVLLFRCDPLQFRPIGLC